MAKDEIIYEPVDEKTIQKWNRRRWKSDGVDALPQGFTIRPHGRDGSIYFREGENILELIYELSGVPELDILVSKDGFTKWIAPTASDIDPEKQKEIEALFRAWSLGNATRVDIS